ncbi:MAG: hypothetical protein AAGF12_21445 [Myxococcota bacterium]
MSDPSPTVLLETSMFRVVAQGRLVTCTLGQHPEVSLQDGANAAKQLSELLRYRIFPSSTFDGLILDARDGPPVFGPSTRESLAKMLDGARVHRKRLGVLVGPAAIQQLQFKSICSQVAPDNSLVDSDEARLRRWMNEGMGTQPGVR